MTQHIEPIASHSPVPADPPVVLRTPADLAEALPYLIGFHPDRSIVLVALHGPRSRLGGRLRVDLPADSARWQQTAALLADRLLRDDGPHGRPDGVALFLCEEPREGESAVQAMERLRPLAQHLRTACGALDVPVLEALCVCAGRWWSYCCPGTGCCPPQGTELRRDGTSVMAAAAAYAGYQVRGSLREMQARYAPLTGPRADLQERALDEACADLVPRLLGGADSTTVCEETAVLAGAALERFRAARTASDDATGDSLDDALLSDEEAAAIVLGLQDRAARDRAAEWMEADDAMPALRLWRALARRCVGAYREHAAAPVTLAGWVCWSLGDEPAARVAFERALDLDPHYTFAKLLNQACHHGLDPEPLRRSLRAERRKHRGTATRTGAGTAPKGRPATRTRPVPGPGSRGIRPARTNGAPPVREPDGLAPVAPVPGAAAAPARRKRHEPSAPVETDPPATPRQADGDTR